MIIGNLRIDLFFLRLSAVATVRDTTKNVVAGVVGKKPVNPKCGIRGVVEAVVVCGK